MQTAEISKPRLRDRLIQMDGRWLEPVSGGFRVISPDLVDCTRDELVAKFVEELSDPDFARPLYEACDVILSTHRKTNAATV